MLSLILKDLMLQRRTLLFGLLYVLVFMFAFSTGGSAVLTAGAFVVVYMMVQTPGAHDDKCHADAMLNSLPLGRRAIVTAKYLSVAVYVVVGAVQYLVVHTLIRLTGLPFPLYPVTLEAFAGLLFMSALFSSVYYPILFRFGYMKSRYVNIFLFAGLFAAGSAVVLAAGGEDSLPFLAGIDGALASQPVWLIGCGLLGVVLGMMLISWGLSVRFYSRREF